MSSGASGITGRLGAWLRLDWPMGARQPRLWRFTCALVVAVVGSVAACAILAAAAIRIFPSTAGYEHFGFADYARLTVIGVVIACAAWPAATLISSHAARPLFLWATVIVTVASLAPDGWILVRGDDPRAVAVLAVMHVAVALVTYPSLVLISPQPRTASTRRSSSPTPPLRGTRR